MATYGVDVDADPLQAFRVEPLVFAILVVAPDHGAERNLQCACVRACGKGRQPLKGVVRLEFVRVRSTHLLAITVLWLHGVVC
jgi:hypothetical protein